MYRRDYLPLIEASQPNATPEQRRRGRELLHQLTAEHRRLDASLREGRCALFER